MARIFKQGFEERSTCVADCNFASDIAAATLASNGSEQLASANATWNISSVGTRPQTFFSLPAILEKLAREQPNALAYRFLRDGEEVSCEYTYAELEQKSRSVAAQLQRLGQSGRPVLLFYAGGDVSEFIPAFLGCLFAGAIAVPAYPPRPRRHDERLERIATDSGAQVVLTAEATIDAVTEQIGRIRGSRPSVAQADFSSNMSEPWEPTIVPESLAFLQYTSGSTNAPKGVMLSHGNLIHNVSRIQRNMGVRPESILVSWLPHFHDMGLIGGICAPLYAGCQTTLMSPAAFVQKPLRWLHAISRYSATHSGGPNFAYDLCADAAEKEAALELNLGTWNVAFNGAEPVRAETLRRFNQTFSKYGFRETSHYPCYGMAETTLMVCGARPDDGAVYRDVDAEKLNQGCAAPAMGGKIATLVSSGEVEGQMPVVIVDPRTQRRCEDGVVGEIWVSDPSVGKGYWQNAEATKTTFQAQLGDGADQFLRTGDLGFVADGQLFVTGRLKDVIIVHGKNYYPQDIEFTVQRSHPSLRPHCGAAFSGGATDGERLVIVQEVEREFVHKLEADEVFDAIFSAVRREHGLTPAAVVLVRPMGVPKTSSGKVQRSLCREKYLEQRLPILAERSSGDPPLDLTRELHQTPPLERRKALIRRLQSELQQILSSSQLPDPNAGLFDLGMDSLQFQALGCRMEQYVGTGCDTLLFDCPTITQLADRLLHDVFDAQKSRRDITAHTAA